MSCDGVYDVVYLFNIRRITSWMIIKHAVQKFWLVSSARKTKAIYFKEPPQPGKILMLNTRFARRTVDLWNFVLLKIYGRPYFMYADRENPCSHAWMWADVNQVEKPICYHGQQTAIKRVKRTALTKDGCPFAAAMMSCANISNGRLRKNLRSLVVLKTRICRTFTRVYIELNKR